MVIVGDEGSPRIADVRHRRRPAAIRIDWEYVSGGSKEGDHSSSSSAARSSLA